MILLLLALAGEFKLSFSAEKEMIKNIYFNLKKTEEFQEYMHSSEEDSILIRNLSLKFLVSSYWKMSIFSIC